MLCFCEGIEASDSMEHVDTCNDFKKNDIDKCNHMCLCCVSHVRTRYLHPHIDNEDHDIIKCNHMCLCRVRHVMSEN